MKHFLILLAFITHTSVTNSQTFVSSSNPDGFLDLHNVSYTCSTDASVHTAYTLNCDMYEVNGNKLSAFAYFMHDDAMRDQWCSFFTNTPTPLLGIHVLWDGSPSLVHTNQDFYIPNAETPDIVIGDDINAGSMQPGEYLIGVVYGTGTEVRISTLDASGFGGASIPTIGTPTVGIPLNDISNGRVPKNPHIDLFGDDNISNTQYHALNKFIVTWEEYEISTGNNYIMAAIGDLNNPNAFTRHQISSDGTLADVAAMGINSGACITCRNTDYAYITYVEFTSNDLKLAELDITGASINSITTSTLSVAGSGGHSWNTIDKPRIEARAYADPTDGNVNWQVVVSLIPNSGSDVEIRTFNNVSSPVSLICDAGEQHFSPVVCGVGEDLGHSASGQVGEIKFSTAYYSTYTNGSGSNGDIFVNETDITTGALASNNYYEANNTALYTGFSSALDIPVAISSASNTGNDLLVVWYHGYHPIAGWGEFRYQFGGNSYSFKPATIKEKNYNSNLSVFPNPTNENLIIKSETADIIGISVINILGSIMYQTVVNNKYHSMDVSELPNGHYILRATTEEGVISRQFDVLK